MRIIGGIHRSKILATPKGKQTRPTSGQLRESLFNICQGSIEGARFLDLFAGSGAMGIEALSRGARFATFIEKDKEALDCIRKNLKAMNLEDCAIVLGIDIFQGMKYLARHQQQFDIIYSDPPYLDKDGLIYDYNREILQFIDANGLLASNGILFLENSVDDKTVFKDLKVLRLKNSRTFGKSILKQYIN